MWPVGSGLIFCSEKLLAGTLLWGNCVHNVIVHEFGLAVHVSKTVAFSRLLAFSIRGAFEALWLVNEFSGQHLNGDLPKQQNWCGEEL